MHPMTRERLEAYRSNRQEIMELEFMLHNRWKSESMIGLDTILNYSRGFPAPETVAGFDQDRYERLQNRDMLRKTYLEEECRAVEEFIGEIQNSLIRRIFQLYFTYGEKKLSQAKIADLVHLDRSVISRKIDDYLKLAHKTQKTHL
nr:MAG TPA: TrfB transcriptional repressor protein/DNA Complex-turn-helix, complex, transcription.5A [Caudoviricetes sp.]